MTGMKKYPKKNRVHCIFKNIMFVHYAQTNNAALSCRLTHEPIDVCFNRLLNPRDLVTKLDYNRF